MSTKRPYKAVTISQEKRRSDFLKHQKESRNRLREQHRGVINVETKDIQVVDFPSAPVAIQDDTMEISCENNFSKKDILVQQPLNQPEWMTEVPSDFLTFNTSTQSWTNEWDIIVRPEGRRCIVTSSHKKTSSRQENGQIIHIFKSGLPGGGLSHHSGYGASCIIDCIFAESDNTYYILDILSWNDVSYTETSAEFRLFWLRSKMDEISLLQYIPHSTNKNKQFRFALPLMYPCTYDGLYHAYYDVATYIKDGLLFIYKQGAYTCGLDPCTLLWKDRHTTRYLDDTSSEPIHAIVQAVFVSPSHIPPNTENSSPDGNVPFYSIRTCDHIEFSTMSLQDALDKHHMSPPNTYFLKGRIAIEPNSVSLPSPTTHHQHQLQLQTTSFPSADHGNWCASSSPTSTFPYTPSATSYLIDFTPLSVLTSTRKTTCDSWSKILFRYLLRVSPLTIQHIALPLQISQNVAVAVASSTPVSPLSSNAGHVPVPVFTCNGGSNIHNYGSSSSGDGLFHRNHDHNTTHYNGGGNDNDDSCGMET